MLRSLIHYWRINVAVILGAAVATSVLTGALLVGDSVQSSLRHLTLGRLGEVDQAIVSTRYVREGLAQDFESLARGVAPVISVQASLQGAESGRRVNRVTLLGVDDRFGSLFGQSPVKAEGGSRLRLIHPNVPLMRALGGTEGDAVILSLAAHSNIHREFLFGREDTDAGTINRRVRLGVPAGDASGGRFSFEPNQSLPLVAFVRLDALQQLLEVDGLVNGILLDTEQSPTALVDHLAESVRLADFGLDVQFGPNIVSLVTDRFLLSSDVAEAARVVADRRGLSATAVFTYLATTISSDQRSIPYSTVAAIGKWGNKDPQDQLVRTDGTKVGLPRPGEILLNVHAAERLDAAKGDTLSLRYFEVDGDEPLSELTADFVVTNVIDQRGLAADRSLTPDFPGVHDADHMADWDAPFPVDFSRITRVDEAYWDQFGATPKAFISLEDGQSLWSSRFGVLSSVRFGTPPGMQTVYARAGVIAGLRARLSPESQGLRVIPLRDQGLVSAQGATDFSGLFFGFSIFLVVSGLTMISQLYKLAVADREREIGLLKAVGFGTGEVRKRLLTEGLILGLAGVAVGLLGSVVYGKLMIFGLTTWWVEAVGTRLLVYSGQPSSLAIGGLCSILLIALVLWRAVGSTAGSEAIQLIKRTSEVGVELAHRRVRVAGLVAGVAGLVSMAVLPFLAPTQQPGLFFAVGASVLVALLAWIRVKLGRPGNRAGILGLEIAQLARFPGRSMSSVTLIALAAFVLVSVGLNRHPELGSEELPVGTGGFRWIAESTIPIVEDLNDASTRLDLGVGDIGDVHAFRLRPGEDISCLNLHRPGRPRILGAGAHTIDRGGFPIHSTVEGVDAAKPWAVLEDDLGDGVVPAIADFNSVQWILHSGLGKEIIVQDEKGQAVRLRFVVLLAGSVLQSEVIISESAFVRHFPSISGRTFFAIDAPAELDVENVLERRLSGAGLDVESAAFRLARYRAVENTYISTFQLVGGLGAVLGILGMGVLMLRNAVARRGELAGMRAIGFSQGRLKRMLFTESALLIAIGLCTGAMAGGLSVAPNVIAHGVQIPWADLIRTLGGVALAGLVSGWLTSSLALRAPIVATLKSET